MALTPEKSRKSPRRQNGGEPNSTVPPRSYHDMLQTDTKIFHHRFVSNGQGRIHGFRLVRGGDLARPVDSGNTAKYGSAEQWFTGLFAVFWSKPDFSRLPIKIRRGIFFGTRIVINHNIVTVRFEECFSRTTWTEPVSAFRGIRRITEARVIAVKMGFSIRTTHRIELLHPDDTRTLILHIEGDQRDSGQDKRIGKLWKDAALTLNLPALRASTEGDTTISG